MQSHRSDLLYRRENSKAQWSAKLIYSSLNSALVLLYIPYIAPTLSHSIIASDDQDESKTIVTRHWYLSNEPRSFKSSSKRVCESGPRCQLYWQHIFKGSQRYHNIAIGGQIAPLFFRHHNAGNGKFRYGKRHRVSLTPLGQEKVRLRLAMRKNMAINSELERSC